MKTVVAHGVWVYRNRPLCRDAVRPQEVRLGTDARPTPIDKDVKNGSFNALLDRNPYRVYTPISALAANYSFPAFGSAKSSLTFLYCCRHTLERGHRFDGLGGFVGRHRAGR
jgi:hypothetical protein